MMMYLLQLNIYKTYTDSLIIHKLTTGVMVARNIEVRQSLRLSCSAESPHFLQSPAWCRVVQSSSDDVGIICLDTTRFTVLIL